MSRIFVHCARVGCRGEGEDHEIRAVAEDGTWLAGHICSNHRWARHDMGIVEIGWKRDIYAKHYPEGFTVEWVEAPETHEGLRAALRLAGAEDL